MATFDFSGNLPQTKGKITSAQLRSRFNDLKTHINTLNPSGAVLPDISTGAEYQALLLNSTPDGYTMNHVVRADAAQDLGANYAFQADVALTHDDGNGTSGHFLRSDGDGTTSWAATAGTISSSVDSTNFTVSITNGVISRHFVDTSSGAVTATLPASPSDGDEVDLIDFAGSFANNNLTVARNSNKIQGTADDLVVSTNYDNIILQYVTNTGTTLTNDKYVAFGGTNEYADCGNDSSLQITGAITVSAWVNAASAPGILLGKYNTTGNQRSWYIGASTNKFLVVLCEDGTAANKNYHTSVVAYDSAWHHICFTYDGNNTLKLYVDGVEDTSVTKTTDGAMTTLHNSTSDFALGASNGTNPTSYATASLDEVAIWDAALTATQVSQLYMDGAPVDLSVHSASSDLQAWWRMGDGDTFPTLTDSSSNSNDGTMTNMESGDISTGAETGGTINDDTWVFIGNN